jgi:hypothetical protein
MRKGLTLTLDASGNVIVAGPLRDDSGASGPLFVAKLDQSGRILWKQTIERDAPPWGFIASEPCEQAPRYASDDLRDSVSPVMVDQGFDEPIMKPIMKRSKIGRAVGVALAALLLCLGIGGGAAAAQGELAAAAPPMPSRIGATLASANMDVDLSATKRSARSVVVEMKRLPVPTAEEIRSETVKLLSQGKPADALPMAHALTAAAPADAFSYLCLGSALLDLGRRDEAIEAFSDCVRQATEGAVAECSALGGRK